MKNYLYHFEFFSGFYESYFYQQINAIDDRDAIKKVVSIFLNSTEDNAEKFITEDLNENWTVEKFWNEMDLKFSSGDEGYTLIWIKEVDFDLDTVGKLI